jgi:iron complex outermembrane recepter protein
MPENRKIFKMKKAACSFVLFLFFHFNSTAQEATVTIRVQNPKKEPVAFATIQVSARTDSSFSIQKAADSLGKANFRLERGRQYQLRITSANYQPIEKGITVTGNQQFQFTAEPSAKSLQEVVVTAQKPLIRQEDDKTIVEAESLVATSTTGYEVIEKTPGLFVDQDGNIYISSLTPATVQINGRDMKMSASDVAIILKSLPPDAISRIEIVRTPSAKYDASGTGGIVNVVLKKGIKIGLTGSINTGMQQGSYGNQFAGFNLNNNDGRKSSFVNLNYNRRNTFERINTDRIFAPDSMLQQKAFTKYPAQSYFAGAGWAISDVGKWDFDISSSISLNKFNNYTENRSSISKISTSQTLSENLNQVTNEGDALNFRSAVSGKKRIDTTGSEWVNDIFFNSSRNVSDQSFINYYYTPVNLVTGGDGHNHTNRNHLNLQSDLKLRLPRRLTLETGARASFLNFKSRADYFRERTPGNREKDSSRTNSFRYSENIDALYLQGSKTFAKDIIVKAGVRLENTNMRGEQLVPGDTSFSIHRTDLFPYIYLSKNIMKIAGFDLRAYLVYRRTISRPFYDQLNPFRKYIDEYLTEVGNPSLRPQFTQNYEANISVDERPILAFGMNKTTDIFTQVIYQADSSQRQAFRTYDNLGSNKEWYFRGLGAIPPGGVYFFVLGAQYNHNFYEGLYQGKPLSFKKGTWTFFTYHSLKLGKRSVFTMNGFLRFRGQQQFYELSSFGALNASINRKFLKDKLVVTLSVNDMFLTNQNEFTLAQGSVKATGVRSGDTRRFGFNLRYNFGIKKKEENNNIPGEDAIER